MTRQDSERVHCTTSDMKVLAKFLPLLLLYTNVHCLNILVYLPKMAVSPVRTIGAMADTLVRAGHNVTTVMPIMDEGLKTEGTSLSNIIYVPASERTAHSQIFTGDESLDSIWLGDNHNPFEMYQMVQEMQAVMLDQCEFTLASSGVMDTLRQTRFDFALAEPLDPCAYTMFHLLGIDKYALSLAMPLMDGTAHTIGLGASASYVPGLLSPFSDRMSFWERASNLLNNMVEVRMDVTSAQGQDALNKRLGLDIPHTMELIARASYVFVNSDPLTDFPRPTLHKVIDVGGISVQAKSSKALPAEWDAVFSLRPHTVLVSFGSVCLSHAMPHSYKEALRNVFRRFPNVTFIWKYEKPEHEVAKGIDNVVTSTWLPQQEILADPRLSLFVTHGGMGSTNEAMVNGVPVVAIPVFADQMRNAKMMERVGGGVVLQKTDLANADKIAHAIATVLENESYVVSARRTEAMLREQPFSPSERLVRHVEFAAVHGPLTQLDPHARHLSFLQFYMLDVIAAILTAMTTVLPAIFLIVRCVFTRCCSNKVKTE